MLSHLWLKNRTIVSRWKIDYAKLNKHRFLARVQMSLHHCAKAAARGDEARLLGRGKGRVCSPPQPLSALWSLPSSTRDLPRGWLGKCPWERPGVSSLAHTPHSTWIWRSGLIWGPERNSQKGTGAKSAAITSQSRTLPLQAQGGRRWASLPSLRLGFFNSVPYKVMCDPGQGSSEGCSAPGCAQHWVLGGCSAEPSLSLGSHSSRLHLLMQASEASP